jgi:hypothetical protein
LKTYITIGIQDDDKEIVFAGQDKDEAFSFKSNGHWEYYKVQTWENGNKIDEVTIQ